MGKLTKHSASVHSENRTYSCLECDKVFPVFPMNVQFQNRSISSILYIYSLFQDSFYEGKDLAEQSEILELPANANPEEYYYGEGRDFEQQQQS